MAAEIKEIVMGADACEPECRCKQRAEFVLLRRPWRRIVSGALLVGCRQSLAVERAAGRERERVKYDDGGRDHIIRQAAREMLAQRRGVRRLAMGGDDVGDEALVAGTILASDDRGLDDGVMPAERGLDFSGFNAVAADLDLLVGAAEVLQRAVGPPAGPVAGAIHPAARWSERV